MSGGQAGVGHHNLTINSVGTESPGKDGNDVVEAMLRAAQEAEENHFKILLLGAGESGKSTVVKQLKLLYKVKISAKVRFNSPVRGAWGG